ncbi:hypothetical protein GCM10023210_35390 [Chryseobacterium ginsengisoli]|uniref:DUF11 domain-containing protein n=1 Tax=Chryseobacterium ginsengisoli TaxID=363853 RepID=A0ABP9MT84_9FLAO
MMKNLIVILLFFTGNLLIFSQSCSVNAGGNATICGTSTTLQATTTGTTSGTPTWSIVSKPSGAPDPVFSNPNAYNPNVTGITYPGNYVFMITQQCSTGTVTSQVTVTAPGATTGFTAGPDITGISAITGVANLSATIPDGYTPSWTYYHMQTYEANGNMVTTNATMSGTTTATPTLTLTNKANHTIDPAYRVVLRITSVNNPSCWYEDDAIVRFIPNPDMIFPATYSQCVSPGSTGASFFYDPNGTSPKFSTVTTNSSANPSFGTTVTMTVVSQPAGGNIQYSRMDNGRLYFSGINAIGPYVFDLTISNTLGTFTKRLTYNFNGFQPGLLDFTDPAYPNQMEVFSNTGSAGVLYCNRVGTTTPITFYYKINPADPPTTITAVTSSGVLPGGVAVSSIVETGAGTMDRTATLTPPSGGWRAGTYRFDVRATAAGGCNRAPFFYVHISDNARTPVNVDNITVCYPGSGVVSATVPLPTRYQTTAANPSYLQDLGGRYDFTLVSAPAGAATPTYEVAANRSITSTSTVISNLNKPGEYVFKIKATGTGGPELFLNAEYACAGTSLEDTFSVFVTAQVGANAGSDQNIVTASTTTAMLNGNNAGTSTGTWSLVSKPAGAPDPVIVTPSAYNTNVTGMNTVGAYTFRWTIATGTCTSFDDTIVNVNAASPAGVQNGLSYWYRADVNTTNTGAGTDVTGWTDVWNGTTVAQLGTNALPKYVVGTSSYFNFNPGINFTVGTQTLGNNTVRTLTSLNYDVFTFTKEGLASGGSNPRLFSVGMDNTTTGAANWDAFGIFPNTNQLERRPYGAGTQFLGVNPVFSTTIPSIMYFRNTNTNTAKGLNGSAMNTAVAFTAVNAQFGGHIFGNTLFSSNGSDNAGFIGNIGETIIYGAGALSDTERRRVDSYLAIKYGITLGQVNTNHYLDADAAIVWNGAANTTYNNNIFGVAREDIGVFHQKVSKSVNAGAILTVATINDFVNPNLAAARTGLANDKTYFLLGDNTNVATSPVDVTVGANAYKRIQRVWMAQEKDADAGALFFETDLTIYNSGSYNTTQNMVMLVADDAAFTTNVTVVNPTSNNASKWVYNQNVADGKFITFAKSFPADIQVNKVGPLSAQTGSTISYTIRVTNNGPGNATNVIVKDPAVANFTATGITCAAGAGTLGSAQCPASVTLAELQGAAGLTIPSLPEGSGVTFTVTGTAGSTVGAVITNTATAEYANDNNTANNSSTVNTTLYGCTGAESTYTIDGNATLAANTIAVNGGTINLVYKLTSGTAVPGIGNQFTVPVQYSDLNNQYGTDNQWEGLALFDTGLEKLVTILPKTSAGTGRLYNSLPANNSTTETLMPPNNGTDMIFTTKIANGALDPLGKFTITIGNFPAAPAGYVVKASRFGMYSNGNNVSNGTNNLSGYWLKPLAQTSTLDAAFVTIPGIAFMLGDTYVWRYSAFSNGSSFAANTSNYGVHFQTNFITFASICNPVCYKPAAIASAGNPALPGKVGITSLTRAGTNGDNWPAIRTGGWMVLESKTKGFVPNRVAFSAGNPVGIAPANFVEGMMVYDTTNKCMKMYTSQDGGTTFGWYCISTQTCPD